jgi:hypothetical protein
LMLDGRGGGVAERVDARHNARIQVERIESHCDVSPLLRVSPYFCESGNKKSLGLPGSNISYIALAEPIYTSISIPLFEEQIKFGRA